MKVFLLFGCILHTCLASHELGSFYGAGQSFAADKMRSVQKAAKDVDKAQIPEFKEGKSPEGLEESQLGDEALREAARNEGSAFIKDTAGKRKTYVIDPKMDPLVVAGNKATQDPLKTINQEIEVVTQEEKQRDSYETCDEGKAEVLRTCSKKLNVNVDIIPEVKRTEKYCPSHKTHWNLGPHHGCFLCIIFPETEWCNPGCQSREIVERHRQVIITNNWVDECQALEKAVDEGTCSYDSMRYSLPNETRKINGEDITRDHFEEHYTYRCFKNTDDKCERLRARGCIQINSECKEMEGHQCLVWQQTYRCRPNSISWQFFKSKGPIFCLSGDCNRVGFASNGEFLEAISHLSIFKEAQADIRASIGIFGGKDRRCTRNCLNFRDCCGNGKGWGVSLHIRDCPKDELELSELRKAKKCVHIGTFCAEKVVGVCTRKQTTFCCFGTKLSRLIQEQAHAQLGLGWGTPQRPECQGLTEDQLSRLDFSKMDLSELYAEIEATMKAKTQEDVAPIAERLQRNVSNMTFKKSQDRAVAERRPM